MALSSLLPCFFLSLCVTSVFAIQCVPPTINGCPKFTAENPFRMDITRWPLHPMSSIAMYHLNQSVGGDGLRPGAGALVWEGSRAGHPINLVNSTVTRFTPVRFDGVYEWGSDDYPVPNPYAMEGWPNPSGAWDKHLLIVDNVTCLAHELYIFRNLLGTYVTQGAVTWNLTTANTTVKRHGGAEAAGLSMVAGTYLYDDVMTLGCVSHALRAVSPALRSTFVWPASHSDGRAGNNTSALPMGARLRLKSNVSLVGLGRAAKVLATAMQTYGLIMGDSSVTGWGIDGIPSPLWNDTDLRTLNQLKPLDFEWVWPPFLPMPSPAPPPPPTPSPTPTTKQCSRTKDCNGAGTLEAYYDKVTNSCQCTCSGNWNGTRCGTCLVGWGGPSCDQRICDVSKDCNARGLSVQVANPPTSCICKCRNQWEGNSCTKCPETFSGPDCDRCREGLINYPSCVNGSTSVADFAKQCQTRCNNAGCTVSSVSRVGVEPQCVCQQCVSKAPATKPCILDTNTKKSIGTCVYPSTGSCLFNGQCIGKGWDGRLGWFSCFQC
eukprot:PhF_6_TR38085/c0_g1_i2/m.56799